MRDPLCLAQLTVTGQHLFDVRHIFLFIFHRGSKRQRLETRSSVRALPRQHGHFCDRSRTYRLHWVDRQHPGKNLRRTSLTGLVGDESLTITITAVYEAGKIIYSVSLFTPYVFQ